MNGRWIVRGLFVAPIALALGWLFLSFAEWRIGVRAFPWSAYAGCGATTPAALPETVRIGLYEEFPVPWRLDKLQQVDFPVTLALAAATRDEFLQLRDEVSSTYPQVREIYFWGLLSADEGYYPGTWSDADGVERLANESADVPVLWDMEVPRGQLGISVENWWRNRQFLDTWLKGRDEPVHIWRTHTGMGLNPAFLRLAGMHFDPLDYPAVSLHLDLYMTGDSIADETLARILRCGVERYGERFIPSLGVLNDGEGDPSIFVPPETFRRALMLVRSSGVSEVWLFGVNGLNAEYLSIVRDTLPLEPLESAA
jgi:hypothetical protein